MCKTHKTLATLAALGVPSTALRACLAVKICALRTPVDGRTHLWLSFSAGARGWIGPGGLHSLQNCCALRRVAQVGSTPMHSRQGDLSRQKAVGSQRYLPTAFCPLLTEFVHDTELRRNI